MNSKKKIPLFIYLLIVSVILVSCVDSKNKTNRAQKDKVNAQNIDSDDISNIKITLSRGAFHYDSFLLIGNELTYLPSKEGSPDEYPNYQQKSKVILNDTIVISLINDIVENNILELDAYYDNEYSCNSMLEVVIKINNIEKKISCEDFNRGCPEALINLESKLITLHGKKLKRIFLPG